jgi:hypothetical protein
VSVHDPGVLLQVQWARFYQTLAVPYEYQAGAPGFWLPQHQVWIVVSPHEPNARQEQQARALATSTGRHVYIFFGPVLAPPHDSAYVYFPSDPEGMDCTHWWCECPYCGHLGIAYQGWSERLKCCPVNGRRGKEPNANSPRLLAAYATAQQVRSRPDAP